MITYKVENDLTVEEFKSILIRSTLGERRPVDENDRLADMVKHANLIVTAREGDKLVGVSRSITDFSYATYLSDIAVDQEYQKQGIGKELIKQTKRKTPKANLILLAAPAAIPYYPHIGMTQYEYCYLLRDINAIK